MRALERGLGTTIGVLIGCVIGLGVGHLPWRVWSSRHP